MTAHQNRLLLSVALLLGLALPLACEKTPDKQSPPQPLGESAQMQAGLDALYSRHDPQAAAAAFRKVLEYNPTHYGATYQLAVALDHMQKSAEAEPVWKTMLVMAEHSQDSATASIAKARLAEFQDDAEMRAGIAALYTRHDAPAAATAFRTVLEHNPTHYGATFQLASALDAAGKPQEARPFWERMLQMAEAAHDQPTADTARARIAAKP